MSTKWEAHEAAGFLLERYISRNQHEVMADACMGEERQFFLDKFCEIAARVKAVPAIYAQESLGELAVVYLHYFIGGCDWHITEIDPVTREAFGQADLGYGPELGYISIPELLENNVEIDLYFEPRSLAEVNQKKGA